MDVFALIFIGLIIYILILVLIRKLEYGKRIRSSNYNNCCPSCGEPLNRIRRYNRDHIAEYISFKIFNLKRYKCSKCGWQGLRWEDKFKRRY